MLVAADRGLQSTHLMNKQLAHPAVILCDRAIALINLHTDSLKIVDHFYFYDNFGKYLPIFVVF